jgi:hypothetical protein
MSGWSLPNLIAGLHDGIEQRLKTARATMGHPGTKGDASEAVWLELLQTYLPQRYQAAAATPSAPAVSYAKVTRPLRPSCTRLIAPSRRAALPRDRNEEEEFCLQRKLPPQLPPDSTVHAATERMEHGDER